MLCNLFKYAKKVELVCCERCDLARKLNQWLTHGGGHEKWSKKNSKIRFFQKFSNFSHMVWVVSGPAWGCCFTSIKVCSSHTNSSRKSKKTARKLLFSRPSSVKGAPQAKNSNFWSVFFVFLQEFVCDGQTFIEVKQHPQAGPETTHTMSEKFENFWKNQIFEIFFDHFLWGAPHRLITEYFHFFTDTKS